MFKSNKKIKIYLKFLEYIAQEHFQTLCQKKFTKREDNDDDSKWIERFVEIMYKYMWLIYINLLKVDVKSKFISVLSLSDV